MKGAHIMWIHFSVIKDVGWEIFFLRTFTSKSLSFFSLWLLWIICCNWFHPFIIRMIPYISSLALAVLLSNSVGLDSRKNTKCKLLTSFGFLQHSSWARIGDPHIQNCHVINVGDNLILNMIEFNTVSSDLSCVHHKSVSPFI